MDDRAMSSQLRRSIGLSQKSADLLRQPLIADETTWTVALT
jgi:hypothetical protein